MNSRYFINAIAKAALAISLFAAAESFTAAQEYANGPVTISKEKVRVNGKVCYSHIVKEKQTLYSIAKAYEVSVEDIYNFNPNLKETGLKKNSIILVPSPEALAQSEKTAEKPTAKSVAKPVAKPAEIEETKKKEEPTIEKPAEKPAEQPAVKNVSDKKRKTHTVKWYEDLDVIAEKYEVTVDALMKANNLTGRKLSKRQKLIIPEPGEVIETMAPETDMSETVPEATTVQVDTLTAADTLAAADSTEADEWFNRPKDEVVVTLILPMKASTENASRNNLDFYSGVLLAVRDIAETGISTELNVYDSSDSSHPVTSEDIRNSDVVIGPVSGTDLSRLLQNDPSPKAVVSPLDPRAESLAQSNKGFFQAPTPHKIQYTDLINWVREDMMEGDTLLVISEKGARPNESVAVMSEIIDSSGLAFNRFSYSILEGRDVIEPLKSIMTATGNNRVLIVSDSEAFVNDVVRNLNILLHQKLNVTLYAPSKIRSYDTIEVENLHNTSLHVSLGYNIDYDNPQIKNFLMKYRALFNTEPSQFAYQGYDIATYFINMCSRYGNRWMKKVDENDRAMLQSTFRFRKTDGEGYVNNGVRRIVYDKDWKITEIK
ncbi:MAG: LysM peptidoglycan-binding domain-containing protein [Bacteroidales bacterium]|nr:LysM peptidoglycan-binding domain-containing protein [Bacteroidales bacterium]